MAYPGMNGKRKPLRLKEANPVNEIMLKKELALLKKEHAFEMRKINAEIAKMKAHSFKLDCVRRLYSKESPQESSMKTAKKIVKLCSRCPSEDFTAPPPMAAQNKPAKGAKAAAADQSNLKKKLKREGSTHSVSKRSVGFFHERTSGEEGEKPLLPRPGPAETS